MIINNEHKLFNRLVLRDCKGSAITCVKSFDTSTNLTVIYILGRQDSKSSRVVVIPVEGKDEVQVLTTSIRIPGAKLFYKDTNKEVPEADL